MLISRVVVETTTLDIAAGRPAIDHVRAGISAGCHVITANKGPVAFAFAALRDEAAAAGVNFLFEGAVMDGIPIFNLVRETLPAVELLGFRGVINSTTNHILTALELGEPFDAALGRMQAEGIAEADPSLDIDGWDAAAKAAALANVLLDARMSPRAVRRKGIQKSDGERARRARVPPANASSSSHRPFAARTVACPPRWNRSNYPRPTCLPASTARRTRWSCAPICWGKSGSVSWRETSRIPPTRC